MAKTHDKRCQMCGAPFTALMANKTTCSGKCRMALSRLRADLKKRRENLEQMDLWAVSSGGVGVDRYQGGEDVPL